MNPTDRQIEIVQAVANGLGSMAIGGILKISHKTVEKETEKMRRDYNAASSCNLVAIFFRRKLIK